MLPPSVFPIACISSAFVCPVHEAHRVSSCSQALCEAIGATFLELMAMGLPTAGGEPEVSVPGVDEFLVTPQDPHT
jgi:hypothetical protein